MATRYENAVPPIEGFGRTRAADSLGHRLPGQFAAGCESRTYTIPAGFARNTKPQPPRLLAEGAHDYSGGSKMPEYLLRAARANQAEQGRAADNLDAGLRQ